MHFTLFDWVVVVFAGGTVWLTFQTRNNHKDALVDIFRDTVLWAVVIDTLNPNWRKGILLAIGAAVTLFVSLRRVTDAQKKNRESKLPPTGSIEEMRGWIDLVTEADDGGKKRTHIRFAPGWRGIVAKIATILTFIATMTQGIEAGRSLLINTYKAPTACSTSSNSK